MNLNFSTISKRVVRGVAKAKKNRLTFIEKLKDAKNNVKVIQKKISELHREMGRILDDSDREWSFLCGVIDNELSRLEDKLDEAEHKVGLLEAKIDNILWCVEEASFAIADACNKSLD